MENKCADAGIWFFGVRFLPSSEGYSFLPSASSSCFFRHDFMKSFFFFFLLPYSFLPSSSVLLPSFLPSFRPLCSCSASASFCSALLDGGGYPFAEKSRNHFLPPKIPAIFSKNQPYPYIFNTPLTHI